MFATFTDKQYVVSSRTLPRYRGTF